jgi:hypothetical protein
MKINRFFSCNPRQKHYLKDMKAITTPAKIKVKFIESHGPIPAGTVIDCKENAYGLILPDGNIPFAVRWPSFTMKELYNGHKKVRPIRVK